MNQPLKPEESDCCSSGCNPCILDVYEDQLKKYLKNLNYSDQTFSCISQSSYSIFKLVNIEKHSKDCNLYTFEYIRQKDLKDIKAERTNLSVIYNPGQHLLLKANLDNDHFTRAYTPIFVENQSSVHFTVVIKIYPGGKMSQYIQMLEIGSETLWRGPYGDFLFNCNWKHVIFIAQGTGIAPLYSILCSILNNEDCYSTLTLWYCCDSENIILREKLYNLADYWNFKYILFISKENKTDFSKKYNESVSFSRLDKKYISGFIEGIKMDFKILLCGSEQFCGYISDILQQCNFDCDNIFVFK